MVAPLGEKARLLEKDKTFGASEGLEPLPTGATAGSTAQQSWNTRPGNFFVGISTLGEEAAY